MYVTYRSILEPRLGIDRRALALFRVGIGLLLLADLLVYRRPDLVTFYTDDGVLPRSVLAEQFPAFASWSLHAVSGALWYQTLLVTIASIVAFALVVGYRTRLAMGLSIVLLASLQARNPLVLNGGDTILLSLCVLGFFLPLSARWSIDARRRQPRPTDDTDRVFSIATATILLHVVFIYAMNAALKFRSEAWLSGAAVPRIFQLDRYLWFLGPLLTDATTVLVVVNWLWILTLCSVVLLPIATGRLRVVIVAAFVGAQLSMAATMRLGVFPLVMVTALALFLPPWIWDRLAAWLSTTAIDRRLGFWADRLLVSDPDRRSAADRNPDRSLGARLDPVTDGLPLDRIRSAAVILVLGSFLVAMVGWHAITIGAVDAPKTEFDADPAEFSWAFFAPNVTTTADWVVVAGELEDGDRVDLIHGGELTADRPPDVRETYPTVLWKRYGSALAGGADVHYESLAAYYCARTDAVAVTTYAVDQRIEPSGLTGEPRAVERATVTCR